MRFLVVLLRAVVPATFAGIAAIRSDLDIGILAFCTNRLIMLYTQCLRFLIHENWLLFYYLDIPWARYAKILTLFLNHTFIINQDNTG
jgi:hypothetical protein